MSWMEGLGGFDLRICSEQFIDRKIQLLRNGHECIARFYNVELLFEIVVELLLPCSRGCGQPDILSGNDDERFMQIIHGHNGLPVHLEFFTDGKERIAALRFIHIVIVRARSFLGCGKNRRFLRQAAAVSLGGKKAQGKSAGDQ